MSLQRIIKILQKHKLDLRDKYHLNTMGIFGSYVRDEQTPGSDVDILVDFTNSISLFEFIDLEEELSNMLDLKVDLVSRNTLKPYIGKRILEEVQFV